MSTSKTSPAGRIALLGVLFAMALVLSLVEASLELPIPVPGVRLGLSNIVVMYCVFAYGAHYAFLLGILKAGFVLITRGLSGALLSFCGGVLSIGAMILVLFVSGKRASTVAVSIVGAVAHNVGQLAAFGLFLGEGAVVVYYLPVLAAAGVLVGTLTAVLLRALLPALDRFQGVNE